MFKKIPYVNIADQWKKEKRLLMPVIEKILSKGIYVGGEEVAKFEKKIIILQFLKIFFGG